MLWHPLESNKKTLVQLQREEAQSARALAERQLEENDQAREADREARAGAAAARVHELEVIRLRDEGQQNNQNMRNNAKSPKPRPPTVQAWVYYAVRLINELIFFNN